MNPSENQNPDNRPQPQSGPAPVTPPQQPAQSFSPQAIYSGSMLSREEAEEQRELEDKANKKKRLKKRLLIFTPMALILLAAFVVLIYTGIIPLLKFKTVTYEDEKGQQFRLKFYSQHKTKEINQPATSLEPSSSLKFLVAKKGESGKAPLSIALMKLGSVSNSSVKSSYEHNLGLCGKSMPTLAVVHNKYINGDVTACEFNYQDINIMDWVYFSDSKNYYFAMLMQDLDFQKGFSSKENAQKLLSSSGLDVYEDDIKTILSSIKPL